MKTGDILYANLGWSAGIPTWWKVIKATEKTVWIRELVKQIVSDDGYGQNGMMMPVVDKFDEYERPLTRRIAASSYAGECVRINDYHSATIWDGNAKPFYTD